MRIPRFVGRKPIHCWHIVSHTRARAHRVLWAECIFSQATGGPRADSRSGALAPDARRGAPVRPFESHAASRRSRARWSLDRTERTGGAVAVRVGEIRDPSIPSKQVLGEWGFAFIYIASSSPRLCLAHWSTWPPVRRRKSARATLGSDTSDVRGQPAAGTNPDGPCASPISYGVSQAKPENVVRESHSPRYGVNRSVQRGQQFGACAGHWVWL
jgi:hypothetical protein